MSRKKFTVPAHLHDPAVQPMLKRLGLNTSDICAARFDRVEHVCRIADTILEARART